MKKNSLSATGLSLSQAQSISNLCNQRAREIENELSGVNNYSKSVNINDGVGGVKSHVIHVGKPMPTNVVELLGTKAKLHACQAFLMENIKAKDSLLKEWKTATADTSTVELPERPKTISPLLNMLSEVNESYGWEQLSLAELNEYLEAEAFASHIGQFIHQGSTLDNLRIQLPSLPAIEWMTITDGMKSPVEITVHHTADQLLKLHEELATLHRGYEQRVNYFKAKVKNLTTEENARIAKINADAQHEAEAANNLLQSAWQTAMQEVQQKMKSIQADFEKERQAKIQQVAALRINVDARFQSTVDEFMKILSVE